MKTKMWLPTLVMFAMGISGARPSLIAEESSKPSQSQRLAEWLERYPEADANSDGVLTMEEVRVYRDKMADRSGDRKARKPAGPKPDFANVAYGDHERQVFDVWLPDLSDGDPKPAVMVFFHGGGFVAGDKSGFDPAPYLEAGFAAASANYRFVNGSDSLSPVPFEDAARMIQTLRHRAPDFGIDASRLAVSGSSAGAVITMWLGYRDDLADAGSDDPVARQSTRPSCVAPINGPTNLDPQWIGAHLGGPPHVHGSFPKMFGARADETLTPEVRQRVEAVSAMHHLSADDPPTCLVYTGKAEGVPLPAGASTGKLIHHAAFGKLLATELEKLGVEHEFHPATDPRRESTIVDFMKLQLAPPDGDASE